MKKIFLLFIINSLVFSKDYGWSTTRFEYWWNSSFNSMKFREPITFIPYKIKISQFYYGGNNYIKQVIGNGLNDTLQTNPFIVDNGEEFNYVSNDLKYRQGISLDLNFLSYNFLQKIQNTIDIHMGLNYKYSKIIDKPIVDIGWIDNNSEVIYLRPTFQSLGANINFLYQWNPNFYQYMFMSYSYVEGNLFETINGRSLINATGDEQGLGLGFNFIKSIENKEYDLHYGLEFVFNRLNMNDIIESEGHIASMNSENIALNFNIGIGYGGKKTQGDLGYIDMINQSYTSSIENFEYFIKENPSHSKTSLAYEMIDYSNSKIAYEFYYNAIINYNNNDLENAIMLFNKAETYADLDLAQEISLKKYIIAEELLIDFSPRNSIDESIDYLKYIQSISSEIEEKCNAKIVDLLYEKSTLLLNNNNYILSFDILNEARMIYPQKEYVYHGKVNFLVLEMLLHIKNLIQEGNYIEAYGHLVFLDSIDTNIKNSWNQDILDLRNLINIERNIKVEKISKGIINNVKSEFIPQDENSFIKVGDHYNKVIQLFGEPNDFSTKKHAGENYSMLTYIFGNKQFRFYFKNNKLFELEDF